MELAGLEPLEGGWSGETFVGEVAGERVVARIYRPGARPVVAAEIDAAVLRLVRGLLPVPEVLEVRRGTDTDPGVLITSFLPGVRGDLLLPELAGDDDALARVGAVLGRLAADLGGMPLPRAGEFVDAELRTRAWGIDGLPDHLERAGLAHLTPAEDAGLREVALEAQTLLDTVTRTCLVHSDLNPKNLLLDPDSLALTGVLDWEFAHAGHPFADLGNLLRFDRAPAYVDAVLAAYDARHAVAPAEALALARAADLWALIDLATRRGQSPVADRADRLLRSIGRARDAGAAEPG